jgi:hypothetical protein
MNFDDREKEAGKVENQYLYKKLIELWRKALTEMENGRKPFDEIGYLEALLEKTLNYKNWNEIDGRHKELVLSLLTKYNLIRESLMGKDVGIIPLEEEDDDFIPQYENEEVVKDEQVVEDEEIIKTKNRGVEVNYDCPTSDNDYVDEENWYNQKKRKYK